MKLELIVLRISLIAAAIPTLALDIFFLPAIVRDAPVLNTTESTLFYLFLIGAYGASLTYLMVLYLLFKLLKQMEIDAVFTSKTSTLLKRITSLCFATFFFMACACLFLLYFAQIDDAPGLGGLALFFTFLPVVAACLSSSIRKTIDSHQKDNPDELE